MTGSEQKEIESSDDHVLRVKLGIAEDGSDVTLDIRELRDGGQGPHGALVGATGSGKTFLVEKIVRSFLSANRPDAVSVVVVDALGTSYAELAGEANVDVLASGPDIDSYELAKLFETFVLRELGCRLAHLGNGGVAEEIPAVLVVVDGVGFIEHGSRGVFNESLRKVGLAGRAARIFLLLADQSCFALMWHADLFGYRIALRADPSSSRWALGESWAADFPVGAGAIRVGQKKPTPFTMEPAQ